MQRHTLALALSLAVALAFPAVARAEEPVESAGAPDVVLLADGKRLEGVIVAENDQFVSLRVGGVTRAYPRSKIASIEKGTRSPEPPPSDGAGDKRGKNPEAAAKKAAKKAARKGDGAAAAPLGPEALAWVDSLAARAADADPAVRRSVMAALRALGPAAIEPIEKAAERAEGAGAEVLRRVAGELRGRRGKGKPSDRAGARSDRRPRGAQMVDKLVDELNVSEEQRPRFAAALKDMQARQIEIGRAARKGGLAREQVAEQLATLRTDTLDVLRDVLSEPQLEVFDGLLQRYFAAHGKRGRKKGKGDAGKRPKKPVE